MDIKIKKLKLWVFSISILFVAVFCFACVSFIKLNSARKTNANFNLQIERLQKQKEDLEESIEYMQSAEGQQRYAEQQDLLPEGESEIIVK